MSAPDDVRARFEAWVQRNGPQYMERDRHNGDYLSPCLEATWRGYRAAYADLSGKVRELAEEVIEVINDGDAQSARNAAQAALDKYTHQEPRA